LRIPTSTYLLLLTVSLHTAVCAEDGYQLWLRYHAIDNPALLSKYRSAITGIYVNKSSPGLNAAAEELHKGLKGLLGKKLPFVNKLQQGVVVAGTPASLPMLSSFSLQEKLATAGKEGFVIVSTKTGDKKIIVIAANSDIGVLYGSFHFLRLLQTQQDIALLSVTSAPMLQLRMLNHWDNLDRYVERGYAGISIWDWHRLPDYMDLRYKDYARANASIGINGTVLTNVNANAHALTSMYLQKVKALADVFRPYGIKVYLTARFSAPVEIGGLATADPLNETVRAWWKQKAREIYTLIPDFGGFLVKANSEGQPGPQHYDRTHADGANMLAEAVGPHGGIVMWRAFVYSNETPEDRFKQAYNEFKPLDGQFRNNVLVQVKNGPIDFQPREPFHPLFGSMPRTPLMMEFQLTQEYLGFATHLVYLPVLFKEVLDTDTHVQGKNSTVARIIDGSLQKQSLTGMAAVANIGNERNWTGHVFGQANWYALGRLAWDHRLSSAVLAEEWIRQTFSNNKTCIDTIQKMMLLSHEAVVNYMTPLGLHHIMGYGHHYGPAPWYDKAPRADWNPVYFHRADKNGIGFDRTAAGSNALSQYAPALSAQYADINRCPDKFLLWFHHAGWNHRMQSGRTLWKELCSKYNEGVEQVKWMGKAWESVRDFIDAERFGQVRMLLAIQLKEAVWWRDACLLYFQTFSGEPIPAEYEQPAHGLQYYKELHFPYAPGN